MPFPNPKLRKSPEIKTNKKVAVKWSVINYFISEFWILFFRTWEANVDFDFNACKHFLYISRFLKTWRLKKWEKQSVRMKCSLENWDSNLLLAPHKAVDNTTKTPRTYWCKDIIPGKMRNFFLYIIDYWLLCSYFEKQ